MVCRHISVHNLEIDHREGVCMHGFDGEEIYGCGEEEVQYWGGEGVHCCGVGVVDVGVGS